MAKEKGTEDSFEWKSFKGDIPTELYREIKAEAEKALSAPPPRKGQGNKPRGSTRNSRLKVASNLVTKCRDANVPPPDSVVQLLTMAVGEVSQSSLTDNQINIAKVEARNWPDKKSLRAVANSSGVSEAAVRKFRSHPEYKNSVASFLIAEIETALSVPSRRGWSDIINIEAKIHQWAEAQVYPLDLSPGIPRKFSNADELAEYLIKNQLLPGDIAAGESIECEP